MPLKTSCCNKTVIRKNLTRFAPVWVCYLLCLLAGLFIVYTNNMEPEYTGSAWHSFWYAQRLTRMFIVLAMANVAYAFLAVQLLFGDLYSSRMCNVLHALPLRREAWFVSNCLSGLLFSLIPTAVFALAAMLLTLGSAVEKAWQLPLLVFAAGNLQYIAFFGIACFCAMAVGKRFTMAAAYALVNLGAMIAHWAITCVYTPMLYGVYLTEDLALKLTPAYYMASGSFVSLPTTSLLRRRFGEQLENAVISFTLGDSWGNLLVWAAVGLILLSAALILYRCRHLERAGDAVAFSFLKPVFLVLCAVSVSAVTYGVPRATIGSQIPTYPLLALGLAAGWFLAKMLVEHTTQVFRLKNWYGLGILAAVMALTLVATKADVLHIEERRPDPEDIVSVSVDSYYPGSQYPFADPQDIEKVLRLHEIAIADRPEAGTYVLENGEYVLMEDFPTVAMEIGTGPTDYTEASNLSIAYTLKNGQKLVRQYVIWTEGEAGQIFKELTSRWEYLNRGGIALTPEGEEMPTLDFVQTYFRSMTVEDSAYEDFTSAQIRELIEAIKRDCDEGNMSRWHSLHSGYFHWPNLYSKEGYSQRTGVSVYLDGRAGSDYAYRAGWSFTVYPDSRHTLTWMEAHGLLEDVEIFQGKAPLW